MREILFQGKRTDNCEWIEGYYVCIGNHHYIFTGKMDIADRCLFPAHYEVIPETVSEYTGRKDVYGYKIFKGDIVKIKVSCIGKVCGVVTFRKGCYWIDLNGEFPSYMLKEKKCEVIGNIHDNPELLEVE